MTDLLLEKYEIYRDGKTYLGYIKEKLCNIIHDKCTDRKVAIRGAGEHTLELLKLIQDDVNVIGIYDVKQRMIGKKVFIERPYQIYPNDEIIHTEAEIVIISSYVHRKEIRKELEQLNKNFLILDIYSELEKEKIVLNEAFYFNNDRMYGSVLYDKKEYENVIHSDAEGAKLKNLICSYYGIRDFINTLYYAKLYVEKEYDDIEKVKEFSIELTESLNLLKEKIRNRKQKDIIIVWNDQVGYHELENCEFLWNEAKESLFMENAFTSVPFTFPSFWTFFEKMYSIDDKIYFVKNLTVGKQNRIIHMLEEKGYNFKYIGDEPTTHAFDAPYKKGYASYDSSCIRCFDVLNEVANSEKPMCIVLHAVVETHNPFMNGEDTSSEWFEWPYIGKDLNQIDRQIKISLEYWSKQLEYYMNFFGDECTKVYMSDHGKRYEAEPIYGDLATHILMFAKNCNLQKRRESRLFPIANMYELLDYVSDEQQEEKKYEKLFVDAIKMQEMGIFNATALKYYINEKKPESAMPYRAARGEDDKYILLSTGKEYYYRLPNEKINEIDNPKYKKRIEELKKVTGDKFIDYNNYRIELSEFRKLFECHD